MTNTEFKQTAENNITEEVLLELNQMAGQSKTSFLSTGLFLKVPIEIEVVKTDLIEVSKKTSIEALHDILSVFILRSRRDRIIFSFMYRNESDLKHILNMINKNIELLSFEYMVQMQHLLRRHYTIVNERAMLNIAGTIDNKWSIIQTANKLVAINFTLEIMKTAGYSKISKLNEIYSTMKLQNQEDNLNEFLMLKYLMKNAKNIDIVEQEDTIIVRAANKFKIKLSKRMFVDKDFATTKDYEDNDMNFEAIAVNILNSFISMSKGTKIGDLFEGSFSSVKTDSMWFKKLKISFEKEIATKTRKYSSSWSNIKNTYRHIANLPVDKYVREKINLVISSDQSGSINTEDLAKLLDIIETHKNRIGSVVVLIHSTQIVKRFDIKKLDRESIDEAFGTRYVSGGTSHKCVFEVIDKMNDKEVIQTIYISLSDNYSDIEECIGDYNNMKKITKFWLAPTNGRPVDTDTYGGTNVIMP